MSRPGYIKLWRESLDHGVHSDAVVWSVFTTLLLRASWKKSRFHGTDVEPGDVVFSQSELAKSLELGRQQVRRSLKVLEEIESIIVKKPTNRFTHVSICNWRRWQSTEDYDQPTTNQRATNDQPTTNQRATTLEEGKEGKKVKKVRTSCVASSQNFDRFWNSYPRRNGKREGKARANAKFVKLTEADQELAIQAAVNYANSKSARDGYARDAHRFLAADEWREWIEPEVINDPNEPTSGQRYDPAKANQPSGF